MEQKHTVKEMQDYIIAQEVLVTTMGCCNNLRNKTTHKEEIELIDLYITELTRLMNNVHIGDKAVQELIEKYAPLVKNDTLTMTFIRNEFRQFKNTTSNTKSFSLQNYRQQPIISSRRSVAV
jgi:hypothetical protein